MIITQLEALEFPRLPSKQLQRKLSHTLNQAKRMVKSRIKKLCSKTITLIRSQYYLTTAYGDMRTVIARNEDIFLATLMVVLAVSYSAATLGFQLFILFLQTAFDLSSVTGLSMLALSTIALGVLIVLSSWIAAFLLNIMSLAMMDGANRKVHRSLRRTVRVGLQRASRVASAWLTFAAVLVGPPAYAALSAMFIVHEKNIQESDFMQVLPYGIIAAITWAIFILMQYGLVPWVALFAPEVRLRDIFGRSRNMLNKKGHLFILFGLGLLAGVLTGYYQLCAAIQAAIGLDKHMVFSIGAIAVAIIANGVMVMLYRKRKLARKL